MTEPGSLRGIAASGGWGIAPALKLHPLNLKMDSEPAGDSKAEIQRFEEAQRRVQSTIEALRTTAAGHDEWTLKIFDSHLFFIRDPELVNSVLRLIKDEGVSAPLALLTVRDSLVKMLSELEMEMMAERAVDLKDVTDRLLAVMTDQDFTDLSEITSELILTAHDLSPLETARLNPDYIKGIVTETGGMSSHTAIMARSLGIPAVTGVAEALEKIENGQIILVNGEQGKVHIAPGSKVIARAEKAIITEARKKERLKHFIKKQTLTADGHSILLGAHLSRPAELNGILASGAEGIGLFRTEFLFMDKPSFPDEECQFEIYREVLRCMAPRPVVIRTLDIGGDKNPDAALMEAEENPFLGVRGLRFSLKNPSIFRAQLRALLRASVWGSLRILFPMVTVKDELLKAKEILAEEAAALRENGCQISNDVKIGIMIEVPAAALAAEALAEEVDFFSIGTNDLIQYTMAADRSNPGVADLYLPDHPAILKLIGMAATAARARGIPIGVCGEAAEDPKMIPILLNLGITELSVSAPQIPEIRERIGFFRMGD